ncbi:MAG: ribonuclease J [Patescibacteria group bacterium]|nr:ribonuclease J [Patescibacteria group bacterium]
MTSYLSYIPLGGMGEVTKNLHVYEYENQILIVDCGLGFANETMIGVDLLLPDSSYLTKAVQQGKKIVGMVITHGHEDHFGALPFILPQLPEFPIYATTFTTAMANEKLADYKLNPSVKEVQFGQTVQIGPFSCTFIRVTHSVPDTAHIFIKTPVGNFYHGSDFKFDFTPWDGKKTDFQAIAKAGMEGIRCLMSESLGADRPGYTPSEITLTEHFEHAMRECRGKVIVTTYSSNISRLNQVISVADKLNKYVCFVGRSLITAKELARQQGILSLRKEREIRPDQVKRYPEKDIVLFVAGSQGQEDSALMRMVNGEHRDITIGQQDVVIISADAIPGNEASVNGLINELSRMKITILLNTNNQFHVSGHGSQNEHLLMLSLLRPRQVIPISGDYRHMVAYKRLAQNFGYDGKDVLILSSGQEVTFSQDQTRFGQKVVLRQVYVDEVSGEEVEQYALHDRQKISQEGIVTIIAQVDSEDGTLAERPEVVARGLSAKEAQDIDTSIADAVIKAFSKQKNVHDLGYVRKQIREVAEKRIFQEFKRRPLVFPVVIEV